MPYTTPSTRRVGDRLVIEVDLSVDGELSMSGRSLNLVDSTVWHDYEDDSDLLGIKLTVCRPLRRRRR